MAENTILHRSGEGKAFWMLGGLYEVLLSSDETNGAATVMQLTMRKGMGPPPHLHHGVTETVYVVDGTVRCELEGKKFDGGPGSLLRFPPETVERIEPTSDDTRVVITYEPGGIDKFFAEAGEPAKKREMPPAPTTPPDVERLSQIAARHGIEMRRPVGA